MAKPKKQRVPILIGGNLALDFVNSLYWRLTRDPIEWFNSFEDLVLWSRSLKILDEAQTKRILRRSRSNKKKAESVVAKAIKLREAIYKILDAIISGRSPSNSHLEILDQLLSKSLSRMKITASNHGFSLQWN